MILFSGSTPIFGASTNFSFSCRTRVITNGHSRFEIRRHTYHFRIQVISDRTGTKRESCWKKRPFVFAYPGERYRIRISNPLPIRVAVNLSVDGLNSITGKPGKSRDGKKWIIDPHSYIDIKGWQVSRRAARRFYFTTRDNSYAKWRSNSWGKDLSVNCGVIGAAFFWSKRDMESYFKRHPILEYRPSGAAIDESESARSKVAGKKESRRAGTGMGERESHPVRQIYFHYDTGMYRTAQAVIIYYNFPKKEKVPAPFDDDFAPEWGKG